MQLRIIAYTWGLARPLPDQQEEAAVTVEKLERVSVRAGATEAGSSQHTADQGVSVLHSGQSWEAAQGAPRRHRLRPAEPPASPSVLTAGSHLCGLRGPGRCVAMWVFSTQPGAHGSPVGMHVRCGAVLEART